MKRLRNLICKMLIVLILIGGLCACGKTEKRETVDVKKEYKEMGKKMQKEGDLEGIGREALQNKELEELGKKIRQNKEIEEMGRKVRESMGK